MGRVAGGQARQGDFLIFELRPLGGTQAQALEPVVLKKPRSHDGGPDPLAGRWMGSAVG
mgnify:CR=1 FL=1